MSSRLARTMRRALAPVAVISTAALIAVGCGGGGSEAAGGDSSGLDYVPKTALLYLTLDTDFEGKGWDQFNELASNVDGWEEQRDKLVDELNKGAGDDASYEDDIKPWLGDSAGMAALAPKSGEESEDARFIMWADSTDDAKAESSLKGEASSKGDYEGYEIWVEEKDKAAWTVKDKLVLIASDQATLKMAIKTSADGPSIKDDEAASNAAKKVDKDAIAAVVVGSAGITKFVKDAAEESDSEQTKDLLKELTLLKAFNGLSLGVTPEKEGMRTDGWLGFDSEELDGESIFGDDAKPELLEAMPASTAVAYWNQNLGKTLVRIVDGVVEAQPELSAQLPQIEGLLGFKVADLKGAWDGEFTVAVGGTADAPAAAIALANDGDATSDLAYKLLGLGQLAGVGAPTDITVEGGTGKSITIGTMTLTVASVNDVTWITNDIATFTSGVDTLGDSDGYKDVVDAADMPDKVGALLYVDPKAATALGAGGAASGAASSLGGALGGLTGGADPAAVTEGATDAAAAFGPAILWAVADGSNLELHAFATISDES